MPPIIVFIVIWLLPIHSYCTPKGPRIVSLPVMRKAHTDRRTPLSTRDTLNVSLQNYLPALQYFATLGIGSPPQPIELPIVTDGGDTFVFAPQACQRGQRGDEYGQCLGGDFNPTDSSTYKDLFNLENFRITPSNGHSMSGTYFSDMVTIAGTRLKDAIMGLVTHTDGQSVGWLGIGFESLESRVFAGKSAYQNLPSKMKLQGLIPSISYSLFLDNIAEDTGSIIFGGYDTEKFHPPISMQPLVDDPYRDLATDGWYVALRGFGYTESDRLLLPETDREHFPLLVKVDTGNPWTYLPYDLIYPLVQRFNLRTYFGDESFFYVDCDFANNIDPGYLLFFFGSDYDGKQLFVPFSELAIPAYSSKTGHHLPFHNGKPACFFGLQPTTENSNPLPILGQTFLRSVYTLYNLESRLIGFAQAKYGTSASNIVEYEGVGTDKYVTTDAKAPHAAATIAKPKSYFNHMSATSVHLSTVSVFPESVSYPMALPTSVFGTITQATGASLVPTSNPPPPSTPSVPAGPSNPSPTPSGESGTNLIGVYVGVPIAVVVVLAGLIIFFVLRKRRRSQTTQQMPPPPMDQRYSQQSYVDAKMSPLSSSTAPPYEPYFAPTQTSGTLYNQSPYNSTVGYQFGVDGPSPAELEATRDAAELNSEGARIDHLSTQHLSTQLPTPPLSGESIDHLSTQLPTPPLNGASAVEDSRFYYFQGGYFPQR